MSGKSFLLITHHLSLSSFIQVVRHAGDDLIFGEEQLIGLLDVGNVMGMDSIQSKPAPGQHQFLGSVSEEFIDIATDVE